ncbi:hypothetical protein Gotur_018930 [Gossypium turneri]
MTPIWKPPQEPFVKVNFDVVFKATLHYSYSGFVIRNSRTVLNKFVFDPFTAEAIHISFHHVDRRANMVAHMIAKERISLPEDRFWVEELPMVAEAFLARDLSGLIPQI